MSARARYTASQTACQESILKFGLKPHPQSTALASSGNIPVDAPKSPIILAFKAR
jgi:hypothetical protein